MKKKMA